MKLNELEVALPPDSIPIAQWVVDQDELFLLYGNAHAKLNGWDVTGDPRRTKYLFRMQECIAKALASGALKTKDRLTGAYQDPTDEAREPGNVDLQDFCDWARQAGITGAPVHAPDLAAALGLQLDVDKASAPAGARAFEPAKADSIAAQFSGPTEPEVKVEAAPFKEREPAPKVGNSVQVPTMHSTRGDRTNLLRPLIARAIRLAVGSIDVAVVWAQLERLAADEKPAPLEGSNSGGIQYREDGRLKTFTRKQLGDRLRRMKNRFGKTR